MRHEPSDTAVAVQKRMNPQEPVMRGSSGQNRVRFAAMVVHVLEALQESRRSTSADRDMAADFLVPLTQVAGDDEHSFHVLGAFHGEQCYRDLRANRPTIL